MANLRWWAPGPRQWAANGRLSRPSPLEARAVFMRGVGGAAEKLYTQTTGSTTWLGKRISDFRVPDFLQKSFAAKVVFT